MDYPFVKCQHPLRIKNKYTHEDLVVGCGKCRICRASKGFRYASLCDKESQRAKHTVFVTLTYAPEFLPTYRIESVGSGNYDCFSDDGEYLGTVNYGNLGRITRFLNKVNCGGRIPTLSKSDLQLFFKRLRKNYGKEVRYFACGEYGPKHYRPHYHLLFYFNSSDCLKMSGHTLGEFPKYTWSKQDIPLSPETAISDFEYNLRKSWRFGRVDCSVVSEGTCSSYVASYVNNFGSVPSFFALPSSKCFCVHSRFLGREIHREEFASYIFQEPYQFVERFGKNGDSLRKYVLSGQDIAALYPRCKGFASRTHEQRLYVYKLFTYAKERYGGIPVIEMARKIVDEFQMSEHCFSELTQYFYDSIDYQSRCREYASLSYHNMATYHEFKDKCVYSVYTELLVSRLFVDNALLIRSIPPAGYFKCFEFKRYTDDDLFEFYLGRIEDMYSYLDMFHLNEMYENQTKYFRLFPTGDLGFFYNNGMYDMESFLQSLSVKRFVAHRLNMLDKKMKHKYQNDANNIFV